MRKIMSPLQSGAFSVLPLVSHLFLIFSQLVFLFHNTGICSEQHPRSRKSVHYPRGPSITIFGCFGLRSEGRAGFVPAVKKTGQINSCPLSRMQQNQSLQQAWKKKNPASSGSGCYLKTSHLRICLRDVNHSWYLTCLSVSTSLPRCVKRD